MSGFTQSVARLGIVALVVAIGVALARSPPSITRDTQKLVVREEPNQIVLAWSGPVAAPMRDDLAAAVARLESDPRRLVLSMNSPGGSLAEGHEVMAVIGALARQRGVETRIDNGGVCASMCVPIYLLGTLRTADPDSQFMFHEATFGVAQEAGGRPQAAAAQALEVLEGLVTDEFYRSDLLAARVSRQWLAEMRGKIAGRDVWVSARRLSAEKSGIVDALSPIAGAGP